MGCGCTDREKPSLEAEAKPDPEAGLPGEKGIKGNKKPSEKAPRSKSIDPVAKNTSLPEAAPSEKTKQRKMITRSSTRKSTHKQTEFAALKEPIKLLTESFDSLYTTSESIYTGEMFIVVKAVFLTSQQECIVKILPKKKDGKLIRENQQNAELAAVWKRVEHPQLPRIHEVAQDDVSFYVASEPLLGISLSSYLSKKQMTEKQASNILFQLLGILQAINSLNLSYQQLTTDCVIIVQEGESLQIKLLCPADLDGKLQSTPEQFSPFLAPEVTNSKFTPASDIWASGVILYYMLSGQSPFTQEQYSEFSQATRKPKIEFPPNLWKTTSIATKTLISLMLTKDPAARLTASQCQANEWIQANRMKMDVTGKSLRRTLTNLKQVKAVSPLKAAILKFMIARVMPGTDVANMAATFTQLDADGNGTLTANEISRGLKQLMPSERAEEAKNQIMTFADKDSDGMISYNEFLLSAIDEKEMLSMKNLTKAFNTMDRDGSDSITATELKRALFDRNSPENEKMWRTITKNLAVLDDGQISFSEFEELMRKACTTKRS